MAKQSAKSTVLRGGRIATTLSILAALLALTAGVAAATSALHTLVQTDFAYDTMGTGGNEWSGATYNGDRNVLVTVDDEGTAYEFALDANGAMDATTPVRLMTLSLGPGDFEGVAWIAGETYAFLSEQSGEVITATVPAAGPSGSTTIDQGDIISSFPAAPQGFTVNRGPEGLATDGDFFYVVNELPPKITKFGTDGTWVASVDLTELGDASGVVTTIDGTYLVLSHESRIVSHYSIDWTNETSVQLATLDVGTFGQAEGLAAIDNSDLFVFGEMTASSQTYAHYEGDIVDIAPVYGPADVNCSGDVDLSDALAVLMAQVGSAIMTEGCGSGDVNGDGTVDLVDALLILQCQVGTANMHCPNA